MSDDKSDKAGSWFGNPLPIVMVVLLAAGVLVKNVSLESARPTDPERVKFEQTSQQDVEARLWQDPFAAVEQHKKNLNQAMAPEMKIFITPPMPQAPKILNDRKNHGQHPEKTEQPPPEPHTSDWLRESITKRDGEITVVAVSVLGGSFNEAAESRRRSRFAVVSALGFHHYHPENADAIGYFHIDLQETESNAGTLTVPFEWFGKRNGDSGKTSHVLVFWLDENKLFNTIRPLHALHTFFNTLFGPRPKKLPLGLRVKLIGPVGSEALVNLARENTDTKQTPDPLYSSITINAFSPSATISICDLNALANTKDNVSWNCFMRKEHPPLEDPPTLPIVRTTGTDDVLAAALLWELWQRGVNRDQCNDGLALIGERDTEYGRTLLKHLGDGFSAHCENHVELHPDKRLVRTFSYLRGLDGVRADSDKSGSKAPPKEDGNKSKDLRAQLEDAPPEHAEGRSQFDYLRRLADEIDRLDDDKSFAKKGVKAIGLVGTDLYDKLIILQALRNRFKTKIFFTTDLDARYLHADQKDWTRNLVVASNFGLSLHPALQGTTLPFRDSYQTATYLATLMALMALEDPPLGWALSMPQPTILYQHARYLDRLMSRYWTGKMNDWLRPHIFEIGRTEAVHLASPSSDYLAKWINSNYSNGDAPSTEYEKCDDHWEECKSIEPIWPSRGLTLDHPWQILLMFCFGLLLFTLANRSANETVRAALGTSSPERKRAWVKIGTVVVLVFVVSIISWVVHGWMQDSLAKGIGEPFVWLEGISVWPNLMIRSVGLLTMIGLWCIFGLKMHRQKTLISKDFEIPLATVSTRNRSWWSAVWTGPHLDLTSSENDGKISALWHTYLRATNVREMKWWIGTSMVITIISFITIASLWSRPSFPHRGELVLSLHNMILIPHAILFWLVIFWIGYETRACTQFIKTLSDVPNEWPEPLLFRKAKETGIPRAHLDDYLDLQLIVRMTQRIQTLIYLPFVSIFFLVLSRSNFFSAMDFPLPFVLIIGFALTYLLYSARLLRKSAERMHVIVLKNYENLQSTPSWPPVNAEQIDRLMSRIRSTNTGVFAPFAQQPALQALLLPFGGYGGVQIIEYLVKFFTAP